MAKGVSFNPAKDIPSLAGKVIFITGGNLGLGKQTSMDLAKHSPAELWIAARSSDSGIATVAQIKKASPNIRVQFLPLDLSSFKSIKEAARTFLQSVTRLDLFYMNAGIMGGPHVTTDDGYERQFGTNHMGHALLFKLLKPLLIKTASIPGADVRTITLSSAGHRFGKKELLLEDMKGTAENLSQTDKYCHSKLANAIYAHSLATYVPQITSTSVYPGDIQVSCFQIVSNFEETRVVDSLAPDRALQFQWRKLDDRLLANYRGPFDIGLGRGRSEESTLGRDCKGCGEWTVLRARRGRWKSKSTGSK